MYLLRSSLKSMLLLCVGMLVYNFAGAQILDRLTKKVEQKVKDRVDRKVDQTIDKGLDKAEGKVDEGTRKKDKGSSKNSDSDNNDGGDGGGGAVSGGKGGSSSGVVAYKSKFDFVPGEKLVAIEDFAQDAVGDFPARWNTNSTGEIVNIDGKEGKWLMMNKEGVFLPEFITNLPENFTLELDLACNKEFSFYSTGFGIGMVSLKTQKQFTNWKQYGTDKLGVLFWAHPQAAGGNRGHTGYGVWADNREDMKNTAETNIFHGKSGKTSVHVSIWRQKTRLRVYLDAEKIWDVPRAFDAAIKYNSIVFQLGGLHSEEDRYFVSNIRLAVGAPDTRNKLITTGKFVTSGILFDVNSDKIKPESYGMIKEIANVLKENADVRVKIIGHTDSDGEDAKNLELSKKRAAAVKNSLSKDFGVDADRMETDGKGESQPAVKNDTPENKAQNRRVEFIKL